MLSTLKFPILLPEGLPVSWLAGWKLTLCDLHFCNYKNIFSLRNFYQCSFQIKHLLHTYSVITRLSTRN